VVRVRLARQVRFWTVLSHHHGQPLPFFLEVPFILRYVTMCGFYLVRLHRTVRRSLPRQLRIAPSPLHLLRHGILPFDPFPCSLRHGGGKVVAVRPQVRIPTVPPVGVLPGRPSQL